MIEKIINGIVNRIRQKYDESKYEIYKESVEQGLNEPCFSILCLSPHVEHIVGIRYKRTLPFIIRYWSDSEETYADELSVWVHRQQCSCRTADCGQGKKRRDTDSPFSMHSVSFIDAIDCYGDHINTDQIQVQSCL